MAHDSDTDIEAVLSFWFGDLTGPLDVDRERSKVWWRSDEAFDGQVRQRFGDLVSRALAGELDDWADSPRGALALVILLDQFTRNTFRGTPEAFSGDDRALRVALDAIASGHDRELRPVERGFLYMPLMHAEDREVAKRSVEVFRQLSDDVKALGVEGYPNFDSHAVQHAEIVERFGRYPHRNETLGRTSTDEEVAFLVGGGPSFGQGGKG